MPLGATPKAGDVARRRTVSAARSLFEDLDRQLGSGRGTAGRLVSRFAVVGPEHRDGSVELVSVELDVD